MDRQEVYEHIVGALEAEFTSGEFGEGEFVVKHNAAMRTITVVEAATSEAFMLLDVTGSRFTGGRDENDPVLVHLSQGRYTERV